ncbi:3-hydroxyisobutyryl-CoA hydrolase [Corynebacterium breve]|uniref:3-hydroxyisobutyryl-CoA hydrolase n=1 Tax=Corynebacterium breve TaxID=3049799 RepID=A0ABY8VIL1_9CORY|nr:3-hydroxyisobutyryl-CoA hydrolase [Corynebacterium breve]WIM68453.1 3-hydroxyisobutyryl-CoA hydrolase [Corynebacterium breve]
MNQLVDITVKKSTGILTLDRPEALNSLNEEMVGTIAGALDAWADDDSIDQVVIYSSGKHFCAGGDVRNARQRILDGEAKDVDDFFATEYRMNLALAEFPKPYIALMNGVVMGGGLGISVHGSHRVITQGSFASMPEMNIGYCTDVGISHVYQNLPGHRSTAFGKFLGLTGYRLNEADMITTGLATHYVPSFDGLLEDIVEHGVQAIEDRAEDPGHSELPKLYDDIDTAFQGSWDEIWQRLDGDLRAMVEELTKKASPSALVASAELFEANKGKTLAQALENERVLGELIRREPDFLEGVRAVLVDKDQDPHFADKAPAQRYRDVLTY